jgi:hypothetical protein
LTSPEYRAYHDAKQRCTNANHKRYADWGGRGIEFRFSSFEEFLESVGPRPSSNHSIDRKDNNGPYEKGNVVWSSRSEQQHNKRVYKKSPFGISGVRQVRAPGLVTTRYQAYVHVNKKFHQLYCGPSLEEAIKARKEFEIP